MKTPHHQRPDEQRVVVTGMGAVTPLGLDVATTWDKMVKGESGIKKIDHFGSDFDMSEYRSQIAGMVEGFDVSRFMNPKDARRYDIFMHYAMASSAEALQQAGYIDTISADATPVQGVDPYRFGVVFGSGIGGIETIEKNCDVLQDRGAKRVSPFIIPGSISNMPAGLLAIKHNLKALNLATATACTTSTHAIGLASRLIAYGDADVILAGGSEYASSKLGMSGFASMHALSTRNDEPSKASRPFDKDRDGFVLAGGSGAMVLESLAHAKARGATILAEVVGFGMSDDATHITAPPTDGEGAGRAMQNALNDAGMTADVVGYINAHGTSTPAGDVAESQAIAHVFGKQALVSSTKSVTGHLLGAAGVVEAIATVQALQTQTIPPTVNLDNLDEKCVELGIDFVPHTARSVEGLDYAVSNSFGFGGTNGSLVFARWQG